MEVPGPLFHSSVGCFGKQAAQICMDIQRLGFSVRRVADDTVGPPRIGMSSAAYNVCPDWCGFSDLLSLSGRQWQIREGKKKKITLHAYQRTYLSLKWDGWCQQWKTLLDPQLFVPLLIVLCLILILTRLMAETNHQQNW